MDDSHLHDAPIACLKCGHPRATPAARGRCPACGSTYPRRQVSRVYSHHKALDAAANRLLGSHRFAVYFASFLLLLLVFLGQGLSRPALVLLSILCAAAVIWALWYLHAKSRLLQAIVRNKLCLHCGYSVSGSPSDAAQSGTCPECGHEFSKPTFTSPAKGYLRGRLDDCVAPGDTNDTPIAGSAGGRPPREHRR